MPVQVAVVGLGDPVWAYSVVCYGPRPGGMALELLGEPNIRQLSDIHGPENENGLRLAT
jgi:hypothetical protein